MCVTGRTRTPLKGGWNQQLISQNGDLSVLTREICAWILLLALLKELKSHVFRIEPENLESLKEPSKKTLKMCFNELWLIPFVAWLKGSWIKKAGI